jgi:hypothetical protein
MKNFKQLHLTFAGQIETVATAADLPTVGIVEGAIRYIEDTDTITTWDGTQWGGLSFDSLTVNNLTVNNLAYINANVVEIGDNIIVLNNEVTGTPTEDAGLSIERGDEPDALLLWDEDNDEWVAGVEGDLSPLLNSSPAFTYARQGSVPANTWLLSNGVPSNVSGVPNPFNGAKITKVFVDSGSQSTYTIEIYEHDHVAFTLIDSFVVTADYGQEFSTNLPVSEGKIFAVRLSSGIANNVTVGFQLRA